MRLSMRLVSAGCLLGLGYLMGSTQVFRTALAQPAETMPSDDSLKKIGEAHEALKRAVDQLRQDSRYESVTKGVNGYSVLVGGLNAKDDLESGHGVDPETFAALHVAVYELKKNNVKDDSLADWVDTNLLGYDNDGHLTYRNKVVRIYPISRLRRLNAQRLVVLSGSKPTKSTKQPR